MSFRIALSGLNAASKQLDVTAHNIANVNTAGFKQSRALFSDVFATASNDLSSTASGAGVQVSSIQQKFGQGNIDFTNNNLDMAISGEGFFVMYELASYETLTSDGYLARLNNPTPWSTKMMPHHRDMVRSQCRVLGSAGAALLLRYSCDSGSVVDACVSLLRGSPRQSSGGRPSSDPSLRRMLL